MAKRLTQFLIFVLLFVFRPENAFGQDWSLDLYGGPGSPAPGVAFGAAVCRTFGTNRCLGVSSLLSHNESAGDRAKWTTEHLSGLYEHRLPFKDEYHFIFTQVALGGAHVSRVSTDSDALPSATYKKWCPSVGGGAGVELPIADLMGLRFGLHLRYPIVSEGVIQVAGVAGVRFGVEWLGFGK